MKALRRPFALCLAALALAAVPAQASYEEGLAFQASGDVQEAYAQWMLTSGDPRSMAAVAGLFERGDGVSRDLDQAAEWYRRAAEKGNCRAMAQLANFSLYGLGGETRSPMEWRAELEKVRGKDPYADYMLAYFYANGHGGSRRLEDALALLEPLAGSNYAPFVTLYHQVARRIEDQKDGVLDAEFLTGEIAKGEVSFDLRWRDKRLVVSGYVNSIKRLRDYGYVLKLSGPNLSVVPRDNLLAVFYAPLVTDPLTRLRGGDYVKIDGVYVGRHPFELEPSALTLFGCNLLQVTSNDADVPR
ncbi:hypothetical protein [uncultured Fretibacterium sp.]|uniref:tetratricopeptide repeat protein n=1 Tax=uncultured Fretibacterium sp. TaxID=1678694 RepID=UPI0026346311|nr:hypothetical protein [uncultured Fretibacterium sp.]